ncbi:MAG TPA: hypothetical protein VFW05_12660 [Verrucomicrobiae bacterium]|nr:hypothetical protein [Verrucomicrobiae bacterium]
MSKSNFENLWSGQRGVAQVSQPAVSPTFKSAERNIFWRVKTFARAGLETCDTAGWETCATTDYY